MSDTAQLEQDLAYVKGVVERRERDQRTPLGISLIWACFALIGFPWLETCRPYHKNSTCQENFFFFP